MDRSGVEKVRGIREEIKDGRRRSENIKYGRGKKERRVWVESLPHNKNRQKTFYCHCTEQVQGNIR